MRSGRLRILARTPRVTPSSTPAAAAHRRHALVTTLLLATGASLTAAPLARAQAILPGLAVTSGQVYAEALSGPTLYIGGTVKWGGAASGSGGALGGTSGGAAL